MGLLMSSFPEEIPESSVPAGTGGAGDATWAGVWVSTEVVLTSVPPGYCTAGATKASLRRNSKEYPLPEYFISEADDFSKRSKSASSVLSSILMLLLCSGLYQRRSLLRRHRIPRLPENHDDIHRDRPVLTHFPVSTVPYGRLPRSGRPGTSRNHQCG